MQPILFSQSFSLQMMSFGQECSKTVAMVTLGNDALALSLHGLQEEHGE